MNLILLFGAREALETDGSPWRELPGRFPDAVCAGCSTAGEIFTDSVMDGGVVAALIEFSTTHVRAALARVRSPAESFDAGRELGRELTTPTLRHVLVFSDGARVNGTALTRGLRAALPDDVNMTGGLAGDGEHFQTTCVALGNAARREHVVAVGLYGRELEVCFGFAGGWSAFGPKRLITHSEDNILYSLDQQPALELYKRYLGERAGGLPATGMLFPLQLLDDFNATDGAVRSLLAVDEARQSLRFAGDMPEGRYVRLMRASADALIEGAAHAVDNCQLLDPPPRDCFALLVSCVGRRMVMGQRIDEEIEAALSRLPPHAATVGFYSYGEISPGPTIGCDLHNQTMTLTIIAETPRR